MKISRLYATLLASTCVALTGMAQEDGLWAVKAGYEIGLSNSLGSSSHLQGLATKNSGGNFAVEVSRIFFQRDAHTLEANLGVGYSTLSSKLSVGEMNYSYAAPASADEDGDAYIRHYELSGLSQKVKAGFVSLPVYVTYGYRCNDWLTVHADLGFRFGFKCSDKVSDTTGEAYSYGVYPQYDDLMINASYMNGFGDSNLAESAHRKPGVGSNISLLTGVGAEFRVYGPISIDLSLRYYAGLTNVFKAQGAAAAPFTAETAPVTYTVAGGQSVRALSDYMTSSKLGQLGLKIGAIWRF